ncbi:uncharacterized protein BN805_01057 [Prevotella sp. CAG:891]|nr:uncharacterized protein BN805_01057 [Prevotella sp. CAG:891]
MQLWGGQNRVFAQGAEVTDVLTSKDFGLVASYKPAHYESPESGASYYLNNAYLAGNSIQLNYKQKKGYFAVTNVKEGHTVKSLKLEFETQSKASLKVFSDAVPYKEDTPDPKGTLVMEGITNTVTVDFDGTKPYFAFYTVKSGAIKLKSITVVWNTTGGGSVETVVAPAINPASQKFSEAFDATITGAEGTTLKYTLDGSDPATSQTATAVEAATATVNIPAQTTTLKAIALKGDLVSQVAEAVYTYRAPSENDGTFAKPYTVEEFVEFRPTQDVWVKGTILGEIDRGNIDESFPYCYNVCIGTKQGEKMAIKLDNDSNFREFDYTQKIGAELMAYGKYTEEYNGTFGMKKEPTYLYIADPTQALASINVKTTEGYATYYNDNLGVTIPEGIDAKCGVITDVNNGALTIDYRYAAGAEIPAGNAVLVKVGKAMQIPLIVSKHTSNVIAENMLKGQATTGDFIADPDYKYYKLAYNNFNTKEGLGFYFGAENGGAFTVPAGMAYLAVPRSMAVKCFLLDGSATGIEDIEAGQTAEAVKTVYTLDGRKVEAQKLPKGIYIVNGKKVIVK